MPINPVPYRGAFQLLSRDFERAGEYIELTDLNNKTYSHRLYELLLRACTEFESICKDVLNAKQYVLPSNRKEPNIEDYRTLESTLDKSCIMSEIEVGIHMWKPKPLYTKPFLPWATAERLPWYGAYNSVKHNRNANFSEASLENVRSAIAGLFMLLAHVDVFGRGKQKHWMDLIIDNQYQRHFESGLMELFYDDQIFSIVRPMYNAKRASTPTGNTTPP
jgi:hypothetical protein